jgi:hypothetical protein
MDIKHQIPQDKLTKYLVQKYEINCMELRHMYRLLDEYTYSKFKKLLDFQN